MIIYIVANWNNIFSPGRNIALYETTIGFRGNSKYIQCNKSKPTNYGIKLFSLADSRTSFMLKIIVYEGKLGKKRENRGIVDNCL